MDFADDLMVGNGDDGGLRRERRADIAVFPVRRENRHARPVRNDDPRLFLIGRAIEHGECADASPGQYSWQQLHALYRLTLPAAIANFQPDYNVCPTDPADVVVRNEGARELLRMRWGLVPYWWNKTLKDSVRLASFNARVETVTTKPFFREPYKKKRCLMPVSGYYEWEDTSGGKQPHYFSARDGSGRGPLGRMEEPRDGRTHQVVRDDN
jgi:hypothetical protein